MLGAAVGATLALVATGMRREPSGMKIIRMPKGVKAAGLATRKGARLVAEGAGAAVEHVSADALREYLDGARQAIDGVVEAEVRGLKRAIRRRRKKLGL